MRRLSDIADIYRNYIFKNTYCGFFPSRIWIEPTNRCVLKCAMCLNKDLPGTSLGDMDFGLYKKIIDGISGKTYDIYLHHRGESLLHPRIFDMIRYAGRKNIHTRLHTNAVLLNEAKADALIESGLDFLSFSFDGYDKDTYEDIRRGANFEKTLSNIINFLKKKQKRKAKHPFTLFTIIEFPDRKTGAKEKNRFLKRFKGLPLDAVRIRRPHNWGGGYTEEDGCIRGRGFHPCTFLWYSLSIFWDGTVVPCPQDFFGELACGNAGAKDIGALWNSEKEIYLRKRMKSRTINGLSPCNKCDRIWRRTFMGVPRDGLYTFLKDNIFRYG